MANFLELKTNIQNNDEDFKIFDDVEIIVDPELEDESTVDINDYLNKYILQCRVCGNMFPSTDMLDNDSECPICDSKSSNGFIFKGKLKKKVNDSELSDEAKEIIDDTSKSIFTSGDFDDYKKDDLSDNYI